MKLQNVRQILSLGGSQRILVLMLLLLGSTLNSAAQTNTGRAEVRRVHCMGQSWKMPVYPTQENGVVMMRADHQALVDAARALGKNLSWSAADTTLTGANGVSLELGQSELAVHGEIKDLTTPPRIIKGAVHIPSDSLEGLLNCRVTVKGGDSKAIYLEPVLDSLAFASENEVSTNLLLRTSVPVRKKVFKLSHPNRTVVDLVGVALPKDFGDRSHYMLGDIKVGQFQLAPSITRIVLPSDGGVKVKVERTLDLFEHHLAIRWPKNKRPAQTTASRQQSRSKVIAIKPQPPSNGSPARVPTVVIKPQNQRKTSSTSGRATLDRVSWEGSRLKLEFNKPVEYRWSRVNTGSKRYVVDFPDVVFPDRKTKLSSHVPGVRSVRVVQNMPEPQPIVRVVCDLKSPVAVTPKSSNNRILYLNFPGRKVSSSAYPRGMGHTSGKIATGRVRGRTICIDAGHGGSDPGALNRSYGVNEKQVTLDIARNLAKILRSQGWKVIMTRSSDRDVSWAGSSAKQELGARAKVANNYGADLFVSIHANANVNREIHGTSIHWYKSGDYRLARLLEGGVMGATGRKNRGLVKNRFFVLAHTDMPAVLIETAFLTNSTEGKMLADPWYRKKIAKGIAAGLQVYAARTFTSTSAQK